MEKRIEIVDSIAMTKNNTEKCYVAQCISLIEVSVGICSSLASIWGLGCEKFANPFSSTKTPWLSIMFGFLKELSRIKFWSIFSKIIYVVIFKRTFTHLTPIDSLVSIEATSELTFGGAVMGYCHLTILN